MSANSNAFQTARSNALEQLPDGSIDDGRFWFSYNKTEAGGRTERVRRPPDHSIAAVDMPLLSSSRQCYRSKGEPRLVDFRQRFIA